MIRRLFARLSAWQDLIVWLPILVIATYFAYRVIPAIDPRAGIDGWGDLFAALVAAIKGIMATILAWLCKRLYWSEPEQDKERQWHDLIERTNTSRGDYRAGLTLIVADRVEYLAWLAIWLCVLF